MTIRPSKARSRRDNQSTGNRPRVDRKPVLDQALTQPICVVHVMAGFFYKTKRHWVGRFVGRIVTRTQCAGQTVIYKTKGVWTKHPGTAKIWMLS